jgi:hypothetical protein
VYVFVIDSHGTSTLLFPRRGSVENRFPCPSPPEIPLGQSAAFEVTPPYGVDTFFLLTSEEALPIPWILEWDGVRTRSISASASWSIDRMMFESVPPGRH